MWIMLRCAVFLLAALAVCPTGGAADRPLPRTPRGQTPVPTIILIPTDTVASAPLSFDLMLQHSLANHIDHLLAMHGLAADLKRSEVPVAEHDALASLEPVPGQTALLLYYTAAQQDERFVARDRHRRRYQARAENCLQLHLRYQRFERTAAGWTEAGGGTISARGEPTRVAVRSNSGIVYCEPHDLVIQRALNALANELPGVPVEVTQTVKVLPAKILLSGSLAGVQGQYRHQLERMIAFASSRFADEFGHSLALVAVDTLPGRFEGQHSLQKSEEAYDRQVPAAGDTVFIVINRLLQPDMYTIGERREEIGRSRLGQRRVYMDWFLPAGPEDTVWTAVANGLTVLHELGHAFGAVHVSDMHSIMNHQANWVGAATFDPLNRALIAAALDGSLQFEDPAAYLQFFTRTLLATPYYLADYPAFLNDYFNWGSNGRINERLRGAVDDVALLYAADAVEMLNRGKMTLAAQMLRAAIRRHPQQASLYYYLSLAVDRRSAPALRAAASRRGYLMAIDVIEP